MAGHIGRARLWGATERLTRCTAHRRVTSFSASSTSTTGADSSSTMRHSAQLRQGGSSGGSSSRLSSRLLIMVAMAPCAALPSSKRRLGSTA